MFLEENEAENERKRMEEKARAKKAKGEAKERENRLKQAEEARKGLARRASEAEASKQAAAAADASKAAANAAAAAMRDDAVEAQLADRRVRLQRELWAQCATEVQQYEDRDEAALEELARGRRVAMTEAAECAAAIASVARLDHGLLSATAAAAAAAHLASAATAAATAVLESAAVEAAAEAIGTNGANTTDDFSRLSLGLNSRGASAAAAATVNYASAGRWNGSPPSNQLSAQDTTRHRSREEQEHLENTGLDLAYALRHRADFEIRAEVDRTGSLGGAGRGAGRRGRGGGRHAHGGGDHHRDREQQDEAATGTVEQPWDRSSSFRAPPPPPPSAPPSGLGSSRRSIHQVQRPVQHLVSFGSSDHCQDMLTIEALFRLFPENAAAPPGAEALPPVVGNSTVATLESSNATNMELVDSQSDVEELQTSQTVVSTFGIQSDDDDWVESPDVAWGGGEPTAWPHLGRAHPTFAGARDSLIVTAASPGLSAMDAIRLLGGVDIKVTKGEDSGTPLWWAVSALCAGEEGALGLATSLISNGADVNVAGRDASGDDTTPLMWAALALRDGKDGAHNLACSLLVSGAQLADGEIDEWQQHLDGSSTGHARWSVPRHKQLKDFQNLSIVHGAVECPVCMDNISRYTDFVESRLCFHFLCVKCYVRNLLVDEQFCLHCSCIKCPECRTCTHACEVVR